MINIKIKNDTLFTIEKGVESIDYPRNFYAQKVDGTSFEIVNFESKKRFLVSIWYLINVQIEGINYTDVADAVSALNAIVYNSASDNSAIQDQIDGIDSEIDFINNEILGTQKKILAYKTLSNQTSVSPIRSNIPNFQFPIETGKIYKIDIIGTFQSTQNNTGASLGFVLPSGVAEIKGCISMGTSPNESAHTSKTIRAINAINTTIGSFITTTSVAATNTPIHIVGSIILDCLIDGVFQVQFGSETTSSVQLNAGSKMIVTPLN